MIKVEALEGIKLVDKDYLATDEVTEATIEEAITLGSQNWGVAQKMAVILRLMAELRKALLKAAKADKYQRQLKGKQMELGRAQKALKEANVRANEAEIRALELAQVRVLRKDAKS